jgi:sugar-phosphatase
MAMSITCKAIIFDLDGVLVDSDPIAERHWRRWAEKRDIPFERIASMYHGRPTAETIRQVAPHLDAEAEARVKEKAEAEDTDGLTAFGGARSLLRSLPSERWAIATSGTRRTAEKRIVHTGLPMPRVLITADDVKQGKPAPEAYLLAAKGLDADPVDCIVFEDAPAGVEAAQAAGARVVAVASTNPVDALQNADHIVENISCVDVTTHDAGLRVARG